MTSYLSNRQQYFSIDGHDSSVHGITYGVPQGSILGPLLFIIYINDIPEIVYYARCILYADDANIKIAANTIEEVSVMLSRLPESLLKWVNYNGLLLILKKLSS